MDGGASLLDKKKQPKTARRIIRNRIVAGLFVALPIFITFLVMDWAYRVLLKTIIGPIARFLLGIWFPKSEAGGKRNGSASFLDRVYPCTHRFDWDGVGLAFHSGDVLSIPLASNAGLGSAECSGCECRLLSRQKRGGCNWEFTNGHRAIQTSGID